MCGRYRLYDDNQDVIRELYRQIRLNNPDQSIKTGEIFPTDNVPLIVSTGNENVPVLGKWGFPQYTGKGILINARSETASEKPTFRDSLVNKRCVVPTNGYFEWNKSKEKFLFMSHESEILYLGGIYKIIDGVIRFVILTTDSCGNMQDIHPRMPIILEKNKLEQWTTDTQKSLLYIGCKMQELNFELA